MTPLSSSMVAMSILLTRAAVSKRASRLSISVRSSWQRSFSIRRSLL